MNRTERGTKAPSGRTGPFATLRALLPSGSGAPSTIHPRLRGRLTVAALVAIFSLIGLGSSPAATAAQPHALIGSIGAPGSGAGQLGLVSPVFREEEVKAAGSGLAVDQSNGDVYVADTGNHRVDRFDPSKLPSEQFVRAWGWGVRTGDTATAGLDACTTATGCQTGFAGREPGQFEEPTFIAVDNTPGGSSDVYVADLGSAANERQTVTVSATGGEFSLSFEGHPTEPIPYSATREKVQTALENIFIPFQGHPLEGNVFVSGSAGGPYTVEFVGTLAGTNVSQMTCDGSVLVPTAATCTVTTAADGFDTVRVEKFDASGNLIAAWGKSGQLDLATTPDPEVRPPGPLDGIAVKPQGNLLLLNESTRYTEWSQSSGGFVEWHNFEFFPVPSGIATDSVGHVYQASPVRSSVDQLSLCNREDPSSPCYLSGNPGEPLKYWANFTLDPGPATGFAVDPADDNVYVARFNTSSHHSDVAGYDSQGGSSESPFGGNPGEIAEPAGVAVYGLDSNVYVADPGAGRIDVFAPGGPRDALTVIRTGTALGSVASEPAGIACPWLCSTSFPENTAVTLTATPPAHSTFLGWSGGGCSGTGVCKLTLTAATSLTAAFTQDRPTLTTAPASAITRHTATLTGTVNPEGDASSCRFEYGPTSAYGAEAACSTHPGAGASPVPVAAELWELAASTTYHYRLVAANTGGATEGPDRTFTTATENCAINAALCPPPPSCATGGVFCPSPPPPLKCPAGYVKKAVKGKPTCVKVSPPRRKCRRGYVKKAVRGKPTCVKARQPNRKHHKRRH